jgi:uncharacterized protein (TIGR02466 family)
MIKFKTLFPSFLSMDQLNDQLDNDLIVKWCYDQYNNCSQPKIKGGWQSTHLDLGLSQDSAIKPLFDAIDNNVKYIKQEIGVSLDVPHNIVNFWININEPGNFLLDSNTPHVHPGYFLSCVYYPKGAPKSGNLYLLAPFNGVVESIPAEYLVHSTGFCDTRWSVTPEPGKLIMFPSWLMHWVTPNYSDEDRISIAFNISLPRVNSGTVGTMQIG